MSALDVTPYVATPVVRLAGRTEPAIGRDVLAATVEETVLGMATCELVLANWGLRDGRPDYRYLDRGAIDFGAALEVVLGADSGASGAAAVFTGTISALAAEYPPDAPVRLRVLAEDGLAALRTTRRTRTFTDATTADIVATLAGDHGLTADVDLDGPAHREVAQLGETDLALLRRLVRADGGELWLEGTTLHVQRRSARDAEQLTLSYGGNLLSAELRADLAHQVTSVAVTGWSVPDKDGIAETADAADLGGEADGLVTGADLLRDADREVTLTLDRAGPRDVDHARALARAAYLERARRFVTGTAVCSGEPRLRVGVIVRLRGLGGMFDGSYRVSRTRHRYTVHGYRTDFDVERPGIGARP